MHILLLTALISSASATTIPKQDYGLSYAAAPGPIPYPDAGEWPAEQSVTGNPKHFGLSVPEQNMTDCLAQYSSGQFYDSWDGNVCAGMGWFKGPPDSSISTYDCYQTCATWLMWGGIKRGASDYQCDYRRGIHGHCWMGYHPEDTAPSASAPAPAEVATS